MTHPSNTGTGGPPAADTSLPAPSELQLLSAIRFNLEQKIAPELSSAMAQQICRMTQPVLGHLILMRCEWPGILQRQVHKLTDALRAVVGVLSEHGKTLADRALLEDASRLLSMPAGIPERHLLEQRNRALNGVLERALTELFSLTSAAAPARMAGINHVIREVIDACAITEHDYKRAEQDSIEAYAARAANHAVITAERLQSYLRGKFTDRPGLQVTSLRELPGGFGKMTFLFDVVGLESAPCSLVLRRDRPNGATETTVADEFPLLRAMHRHGLPVAEPLWLEPGPALDYPFIVVRRLEGRPAGDLWKADPNVCSAETARDLASVLARLHSLDPGAMSLGPRLRPAGAAESVAAMLAEVRELWMRKRLEPDAALQASLCWLEHNIPPPTPRAHLVHSDVGFHNLLIANEKVSGLLDWELAHLGDPVEDLSYVRPYIEQLLPWKEFLAAYRNAGGSGYSEDRARYFSVWRGVRNTVYTLLCHHAFCTDANLDLRFAHAGVYYPRLILLEAAQKVAELGARQGDEHDRG